MSSPSNVLPIQQADTLRNLLEANANALRNKAREAEYQFTHEGQRMMDRDEAMLSRYGVQVLVELLKHVD